MIGLVNEARGSDVSVENARAGNRNQVSSQADRDNPIRLCDTIPDGFHRLQQSSFFRMATICWRFEAMTRE